MSFHEETVFFIVVVGKLFFRLFVRSYVCTFVRLFVGSLVRTLVRPFVVSSLKRGDWSSTTIAIKTFPIQLLASFDLVKVC